MAENYPWYEVVAGDKLLQGDMIYQCPVIVPTGEIPDDSGKEEYALEAEITTYDVVIMSQSCDLEQEKLDMVLFCPHWPFEEFINKNDYFKSSRGKEDLKRGNIPGYHLLNRCELEGWEKGARVVDFRNVYNLPYPFLKKFAEKRWERLRLLPPYREHLSQAFARFFMRVGLPVQVDLG
jgi:hypothetical protein